MAAKKKSPKKPQERNLTRELAALLAKTLLPDLEARAKEPSVARALAAQYESEKQHTADKLAEWITRTLEQVAVAWILSCVFIRTLEDRGYLTHPRLAGEGAADSEHLFFDLFPSLTQRDYLLAVFRELSHLPGGEDVLGPQHNPAWRLAPSTETVRALLAFFREVDGDGQLVWKFAGESTRFLGDLYQDVSEAVRERYALLQTPEFVEEFILDLTLDPAIAEFGLEDVRLLDPTCGSGHFLLGAFRRLFDARQRKAPGVPAKEHAAGALAQVYGADINPYAAAIARFRLVLAYLHAAEIDKLKNAPRVPTNVVVADSLRFAANKQTLPFAAVAEDAMAWGEGSWQLEDPKDAQRIFAKTFHAVVGNPPYITCKDAKLREEYRAAYRSAAGKYALSAPFTERFFQLAIDGGFVGMINANSFMKREFGRALIEKVLPAFELTRVVDTAGAYIPGHGTPTVLLFGRSRTPIADKVMAVLGKRGEPVTPTKPESGHVWSSIQDHFGDVGFENDFISVSEVPRTTFSKHPWSLGGGGAADLKELLEQRAERLLSDAVESIGFMTISGEDDAYVATPDVFERQRLPSRGFGIGEVVRDWRVQDGEHILFPYDDQWHPCLDERTARWLWPLKTTLRQRLMFGKTQLEAGLSWFEYRHVGRDKLRAKLSIAFAFVATHNHFVVDRGGKVFNRSAPVIKLSEHAKDDEHFALLAYLNSSTACFWMKQVFYPKARSDGDVGEDKGKPEANRYEFAGTALLPAPIPKLSSGLAELGGELTAIALERAKREPAAMLREWLTGTESLDIAAASAQVAEQHLLGRMVAIQEDIDWLTYSTALADIPSAAATSMSKDARYRPTERPFEASVSPSLSAADAGTWRERRLCFEAMPQLAQLENAVQKRSWVPTRGAFAQRATTFEERLKEAAEALLALQIEQLLLAEPATSKQLASALERHQRHMQLTALLSHLGETPLEVVTALLLRSAVPYLSSYRCTDSGLVKHAVWEHVWNLQRREDAGEVAIIPVPPKYDSKDFRDAIYWRLRGKLDVPKERFISYPGAEKDDDKSPLFGWAGWDHLQQATALAGLFHERKTEDGWPADRLVPLLAGLLELVPWLKQWHNEPNDELGGEGPGDWYERYVEAESRSLGKSLQDLRDWRPMTGRKKAK